MKSLKHVKIAFYASLTLTIALGIAYFRIGGNVLLTAYAIVGVIAMSLLTYLGNRNDDQA